jgi:hypothetical protein
MKILFEMQAAIIGNHLAGQILEQDERLYELAFVASNNFSIVALPTVGFSQYKEINKLDIKHKDSIFSSMLLHHKFNSPKSLQSYLSAMKIGLEELAVEYGEAGEWVDDSDIDINFDYEMKNGGEAGNYIGYFRYFNEEWRNFHDKQDHAVIDIDYDENTYFRTIPQLTITPEPNGNGQIYTVWG